MNVLKRIDKVAAVLLLIIFMGIVLHAPFTVVMSNFFPKYSLIFKSWKELLMLVLFAITAVVIYKDGSYREIARDKIVGLIALYSVLHILLATIFFHDILVTIAGLMIDLRYIVFFLLVYIWAIRLPAIRPYIIKVAMIGAFLVCGFALAQIFILPYDVLSYIGYNKDTIIPYLLVDNSHDFLRINSTLRGPNPLGAYSVIVISLLCAFMAVKNASTMRVRVSYLIALAAVAMTLWASYSRGALIAGVVGVVIVFVVKFLPKLSKKFFIIAASLLIIATTCVAVTSNNNVISHVLLHQDPASGRQSISNMQHVDSLRVGAARMLAQPFGGGIGSTGSASLHSTEPLIVENQYLFIAHETGWSGLIMFVGLMVVILKKLWKRKADWLGLGLFASGIGLSLIGLLLPVWSDDTVSIIWWGLAGLALAQPGLGGDIARPNIVKRNLKQ